jgi:hypothetical protein
MVFCSVQKNYPQNVSAEMPARSLSRAIRRVQTIVSAEVGGYRRASLPACQELARTRPWINYDTYSWFPAHSRKSQALPEKTMRQQRARRQLDCGSFLFSSSYAKLAHEICHIKVHDKAHKLACLVEFLFKLVFDIKAIPIARDSPLRAI